MNMLQSWLLLPSGELMSTYCSDSHRDDDSLTLQRTPSSKLCGFSLLCLVLFLSPSFTFSLDLPNQIETLSPTLGFHFLVQEDFPADMDQARLHYPAKVSALVSPFLTRRLYLRRKCAFLQAYIVALCGFLLQRQGKASSVYICKMSY